MPTPMTQLPTSALSLWDLNTCACVERTRLLFGGKGLLDVARSLSLLCCCHCHSSLGDAIFTWLWLKSCCVQPVCQNMQPIMKEDSTNAAQDWG